MEVVGAVGAVGTMGAVGVVGVVEIMGVVGRFVGILREDWKKLNQFSLNSFSHFAMISASEIVFKKPLANKKLKLS